MQEIENYQSNQMQRDLVLQRLKERGCRITRQRLILLDIILEGDCSCCKEIYYQASRQDPKIGSATVYRMVNILEEIGAISRRNMYKIDCGKECEKEHSCRIHLDDQSVIELSPKKFYRVIQSGLAACGYSAQKVLRVTAQNCDCAES